MVGLRGGGAGGTRTAGRNRARAALAWRRYRERGLSVTTYLPLLLLPAAELGFFAYLYWRTCDPMAHFHAQVCAWGRGVSVLPWCW